MPVKPIKIEKDPNTYEGDNSYAGGSGVIPQPSAVPYVHPEDAPTGYAAPSPVSAPLQQAQQASQAPEVSKQDEIVKRLYTVNEPKPTLDLEKEARLQRMGKINQIGRGIGLMTDALSLGMGGSVKRRAPDNVSPAIYQSYQNMLDQNKNATDNWNLRNTAQKRANIGMELQVQYKKDADQLQREKMELSNKMAQAKSATELAKWKLQFEQKERDIENRNQQHKDNLKMGYARITQTAKNKEATGNKPVNIMTSSGNKYQLPPEELSYLTNEATGNEAIASDPKFSNWFIKTEIMKQVPNTKFGGFDKVPSGEYTYKLKPSADKHALAQSMLDLWEQGKISLPGRKDQSRIENDSTVPAWTPPVPGTVTGPAVGRWAPQQQAPAPATKGKSAAQPGNKAVPSMFQSKPNYSSLNFGNDNATNLKSQPASAPKKQYSTGGYY